MIRIAFILWVFFLVSVGSYAQTYLISSYNNQTITTCSGSFYDSGGPSGGYVANQSYKVTFAPLTSGTYSNLTFTSFNVAIGDMLEVFDGASIASPLIGIYNNGNSPVGITIRPSLFNVGGKLTLRWTSVGASSGWSALVACGVPCQDFNTVITSSTPPFTIDSGIYFIDICPGDSVSLNASANFPYNNFFYHQDTLTTNFSWNFGGATIVNGQNINAVFNNVQGYNAFILAEDSNGCFASQATEVRVRVSTPPVFSGTNVANSIFCQFDSTVLNGFVTPTHWQITPSLSVAGTTYLPDGSGVSYTSNLVFAGFSPGQTLQNAADILKVFAEIEHSYLGDLNIVIKCPNNSSVTLKSYPGGTSTFLGEPIDNNAAPIPGLGYMYHWKSTGTTTMLGAAGTYSHNFTDVLNNYYSNHAYIPPSSAYPATSTASAPFPLVTYLPETPFTTFLGCPLNGSWSITVTDNLGIDNGFIFSWGIDFDPAILPVTWGYTPIVDSTHWNTGIGDTTFYQAMVPGAQDVIYTMIDGAGCSYDTTINIFVNPAPVLDLGNDTAICVGDQIIINSGNTVPGVGFIWNTGGINDTINIQANSTNTYSLTATTIEGCVGEDSIEVAVNPLPQITLSNDTLICIGTEAVITATGGDVFTWSNGMSTQTIQVSPNQSTIFQVTVIDSNQCVDDSAMLVTVTPLPIITTSNDTTICDGTSATIWAEGGIIYTWNNSFQGPSQVVSPVDDQTFMVIVEDINTCQDSAEIVVDILELPLAEIYSDYDTLCRGGSVTLVAQGGMSYVWDNGHISNTYDDIPKESTTYTVEVINSKNGTNCYDQASYFVYVEHCALYVPSAFTPNGDGLNDLFGPIGIVSNNAFYELLIYDRWGRLVFKTNDKYHFWDGMIDGQKPVMGVYSYVIRVSEKSIEPYEISGTTTLVQ